MHKQDFAVMNTKISHIKILLLVSTIGSSSVNSAVLLDTSNNFVVDSSSDPGTLLVQGDLSAAGAVDFGTTNASSPTAAVTMDWNASSKSASIDFTEPNSSLVWRDNLENSIGRNKMELSGDNDLSIYNASGGSPSIVLSGSTGAIMATTLSVSGSPAVTNANLATALQQTTGFELGAGLIQSNHWESGISMGYLTSAVGSSAAFGVLSKATAQAGFAAGWAVEANGIRSAAFGHGAKADGYESFALGRSTQALGNLNFVGGWHSKSINYNSFVYGHLCLADSKREGEGYDSTGFAIALGSYARAEAVAATAVGYGLQVNTPHEMNFGSWARTSIATTTWNETDALFRLGNGDDYLNRSDAITTLKNGCTILTNKAWKADPAVIPASQNSFGEALVVEGNTRLKGDVVLDKAQGDISMGIFE
ncbi:hypothetical protein HNR46_003307 [Haloferula luteola]|uniref:Trimeric autotransporter adhesin YadA-like head domain-containing protein n=1 Tax=Haloferula luteola TaxID=595692 RepID=A0A840VBY0_9BACT|nr:hypothetical protein [Haloferula luteola]MBB5353054.1 hypothetical protein [Haloferula luteola]